jgi:hypothetical protein
VKVAIKALPWRPGRKAGPATERLEIHRFSGHAAQRKTVVFHIQDIQQD